jgi:uncharacterized protein YdbL (DUF1318 family)
MKTIWKILGGIGLLLVIAFSGAIGKLVGKASVENYYAGKNDGAIDEALQKAAGQMSAKLPMMVDSDTRWDSIMGINKTLRHNYTLVNYSASAVSADDIKNGFGQKLVNRVCTSEEMQVFVKNGVTVSYAYYGNEGKQIIVISIAPSQCGGT